MLKFFRKYNAVILAVAASFLMVAFLMPQAIQRIAGDPRDQAEARLTTRKITIRQSQEAAQELNVLKQIGGAAASVFGVAAPDLVHDVLGVTSDGDVSERLHWIMLVDEARQGGYIAGPGAASIFLNEAADFYTRRQIEFYSQFGNDPTSLEGLIPQWRQQSLSALNLGRQSVIRAGANGVDATNRNAAYVDSVLAKAAGVSQMYSAVLSGAPISDLEAIDRVRESIALDSALVHYLVIRGDDNAAQAPEPTEEQIDKFFDTYKDVSRADSEFGIGYLRPAAANFEWLEINREFIGADVEVTTLDLFTQWRQDRVKYKGAFDDERDRVEKDIRDAKAEEIARFASQVVQAEILKSHEKLAADGQYKRLPDDWAMRRPDFDAIADLVVERVRDRFELTIQKPRVLNRLAWRTFPEIGVETGLGQSARGVGPNRRNVAQLIFGVREFGASTAEGTQVGLTFGPTETFNGNRYFVRVLEIRKKSPPDSVDQVRGSVIVDWQRKWAYDQLLARESELVQRAAIEGLDALALDVGVPGGQSIEWEVRTVSMTPADTTQADATPDPNVNTPEFRKEIIDAALAVPPGSTISDVDPTSLTVTRQMDRSRSLVIASIVSINPMSKEEFRKLTPALPLLSTAEARVAMTSYAPLVIARRLGFKYLGQRDDEFDETAPDPALPADSTDSDSDAG